MIQTAPSLWLHSRRYDLWWYGAVPCLLFMAVTAVSWACGDRGPMIAYLVNSVLIGLPHNMITWLLILPRESRDYYRSGIVFGPFVLTALVVVPTLLLFGTPTFAWALSINMAIAYYHITRQHMGILHSCDGRYIQATGDQSVRTYSRDWRSLVALTSATCLAWKTCGGPMKMGLTSTPMAFSFYPGDPAIAWSLSALTALVLARLVYNTYRRAQSGARFPISHLLIGGGACANLVGAALVPNDQFFLTLALVASCHNAQYFAFCYTHHHLRAVADAGPRDPFTRWAREGKAVRWFALPVLLGALYGGLCSLLPRWLDTGLIVWFMTNHYFVDGKIWQRRYYPLMGRFASGQVFSPAPAQATDPEPERVAA